MSGSVLEAALRRERLLASVLLLAITALAWGYLLAGAGMHMPPPARMLQPLPPPAWTPGKAAIMVAMWAVMMAAMMLPSAAPTILLYATIARRRRDSAGAVPGAGLFVLGYLAVWTAFSVAATVLQYAAERAALMSSAMRVSSVVVAGAVLLGAGLYQWTPLKRACLRHCRSPIEFLAAHWREGAAGAVAMGARHGVYCLGCCWVLMLLLFVGGVMNLAWIGGIAIYVLVEKLAAGGEWIARAAGLALAAWGIAVIASA